jgi:hypothetical protein
VAETRTLAGARLHSLVGELSSCAETVDISSLELSADVLSCLEAPLRGLSALVANPSDAPHAPMRMEDRSLPAAPTDAPPIWPNTSNYEVANNSSRKSNSGGSWSLPNTISAPRT